MGDEQFRFTLVKTFRKTECMVIALNVLRPLPHEYCKSSSISPSLAFSLALRTFLLHESLFLTYMALNDKVHVLANCAVGVNGIPLPFFSDSLREGRCCSVAFCTSVRTLCSGHHPVRGLASGGGSQRHPVVAWVVYTRTKGLCIS